MVEVIKPKPLPKRHAKILDRAKDLPGVVIIEEDGRPAVRKAQIEFKNKPYDTGYMEFDRIIERAGKDSSVKSTLETKTGLLVIEFKDPDNKLNLSCKGTFQVTFYLKDDLQKVLERLEKLIGDKLNPEDIKFRPFLEDRRF